MEQLINWQLIESLKGKALESPRKRLNFNFHPSLEDNPHRFLNVFTKGTFVAPHRHLNPPKSESFIVLEGEMQFFLFDEHGNVAKTYHLSPSTKNYGIDIPPGVYHTLIPISDVAVCFEVKPGSYEVTNDKEFAPWAPTESSSVSEKENYLNFLESFIK